MKRQFVVKRYNLIQRSVVIAALIVFGVTIAAATAEEAGEKAGAPAAVSVVCRDLMGEAVTAAEVYLFQHTGGKDGRYERFGPFESDMRGVAVCPKALFTSEDLEFDRFIYARVPGKLVGVARSAKWRNQKAFNSDGLVKLAASCSVEGKVNVPDGFDPTKVLVRVDTLHVSTGDEPFAYESFPRQRGFSGLDTALPEIFDRRPDKDGRVVFDDVPERGHLYLHTHSEGLGEGQWRNAGLTFDDEIAIDLEPEATITGVVTSPEGNPVEGIDITIRRSDADGKRVFTLSSFHAQSDADGVFAIRGLPVGATIISAEDPLARWVFRPREGVALSPKAKSQQDIALETGVRVSGRVTDDDGKPVESAAFSALADTPVAPGLDHSSTDADGRYSFRLPAGAAQLYFNSLPDGFEYPRPQIVKRLEIEQGQSDIADLDFILHRRRD